MIEFETIQNSIQKYKHLSVAELIFERLILIEADKRRLYPFWRLLVLLKWSFLLSKEVKFKRRANVHDLNKLISLIETFESSYSVINLKTPREVKQFFRIIAYQQFAHQSHYSNSIIDRQLVLYCQLDSGINIQDEFRKLTGIDLIGFFNFCYTTYLYLHFDELGNGTKYNGRLNSDYFEYCTDKYSRGSIDQFLKLLTIKNADDFEELHKLKKEILQLYETNFFVTKPFILFKGEYRIPHRSVFLQTVSYFVYNYLKINSPAFPDTFGSRLEKYVELGILESKLPYFTDNELKKKYTLTKVVDFLVSNDILIEVKATELHPRSGVSRASGILQDDLKTSIIKAYSQLLSTAEAIDKNREWYGVIITYKEMYLGFGPEAWEEFLKEPIEEFIDKNKMELKTLPPDNLFFISISDWDWIVQTVKDLKVTSLKEIFKKGKECNVSDDQQTKVFMMEQVLNRYYRDVKFDLSYLKDAHRLLDVLPTGS